MYMNIAPFRQFNHDFKEYKGEIMNENSIGAVLTTPPAILIIVIMTFAFVGSKWANKDR